MFNIEDVERGCSRMMIGTMFSSRRNIEGGIPKNRKIMVTMMIVGDDEVVYRCDSGRQ